MVSSTSGGILDRAIEAEELRHKDFLRLVIFLSFFFNLSLILHETSSSFVNLSVKRLESRPLGIYIFCLFILCEQDHTEGYLELSAKTKTYFSTAVALWDAEFYIKVDDDVHVNLGKFELILYLIVHLSG